MECSSSHPLPPSLHLLPLSLSLSPYRIPIHLWLLVCRRNRHRVNQFYSLLEETDVLQSWNGVCSQLEEQLGCFSAEARLLACQQQSMQWNLWIRETSGDIESALYSKAVSLRVTLALYCIIMCGLAHIVQTSLLQIPYIQINHHFSKHK